MMEEGYVKFRRLMVVSDLVCDPNAASLLMLIASRARFHDGPNVYNLKIGEAMVGDYKSMKLTPKKYRCALERLEHKWKQITTRGTNRGTIAKLTDLAIFDIYPANSDPTNCINPLKGRAKGQADFIGETGGKGQTKGKHNVDQAGTRGGLTNNERRKEGNNDDDKALGNSLPGGQGNASAQSSISFSGSYQNHIKWPEFAAHAKRLGKMPTAEWFEKWLAKQKPQWRNRKSPQQEVSEKTGYLLHGKFLTQEEATQRLISDPALHDKFRPAIRRNGKIIPSDNAA
jgi:hypothetical protein